MANQNAPRVADAHEQGQTASVGSGPLLGVLREIAEEMRSCESQCIHAPKAKAMYASRAEKIEAALVEVASLRELLRKADDALKHHGGMQYTETWLARDIEAALGSPNASDEPRPLGAVGSGRLLGARGNSGPNNKHNAPK